MSVKALQDYTFVSKYARYLPEKKRRETWDEAIERVRDMHLRRYPQIKDDITWAFEQVRHKRVLGSQRALQFGGAPIEKKHARIYNCIGSYCDRLRFFQECFWLLLCGCGAGFSVQRHHIAKLPDFSEAWQRSTERPTKDYVIDDSIEGWADALGVLMDSFHGIGEYADFSVIFDYSLIRPEGAALSSSSGRAPGPGPLRKAIEEIRGLIIECLELGHSRLKPITAYDVVMYMGDAVISGGVRRSATICLFSPDDMEMAKAKTGDWFTENPQRGRSNNSALLVRGETSKEEFHTLMEFVKEFGEPGFIWADSTEIMVNPCVTADTVIVTAEGLKLVENLLDKPFDALVDGKPYKSNKGFWLTGEKSVMLLEFESGRTLKVTPNHNLLTTHGWKEASEIGFDEEVVIHNHRSGNWYHSRLPLLQLTEWNRQDQMDFSKGYCLGAFLADGNVSKGSAEMKWWGEDREHYRKDCLELLKLAEWHNNHHKEASDSNATYLTLQSNKLYEFAKKRGCLEAGNKELSVAALEGSWRYLSGVIAGYFDADGTVAVNHKKGCSLRFTSVSLTNLKNLQIALNAFGVYSKIYNDRYPEGLRKMPDGNGGQKEYYCQATHELVISCDSIQEFQSMIPIRNQEKIEKIESILSGYKRTPNRTHFVDRVIGKQDIGVHRVYDAEVAVVHAFDANAVYAHNCVEIGFYPVDITTGESGWQACNLCEINGRYCKTEEAFHTAAKAAAIIGTCQAGYTDLEYLGPTSKRILDKEALLGVSITGMMDNPEILFDPKIQRRVAKLILKVNEEIAGKIGINPTARATCVKPAGTTSCILGTASGIHPHHAYRYIRRAQANYLELPLNKFKKSNPAAVEKSVWSTGGTDEVIAFCIEVPAGSKTKNDIDALELMSMIKLTQQNWVEAGKVTERCTQPWLAHNVSNTISVKSDEWDMVESYIYKNRKWFAGVSLLSITGDKDFPQAPFSAIYTPTKLVSMYGDASVFASGLIVDGLHAFEDNLWHACDAVLAFASGVSALEEPMTDEETTDWLHKVDWVRRATQFADHYFEGDIKKMTYCLKDVNNWHYWCSLQREYKDVDYSEMVEEKDTTKIEQAWACAGGSCQTQYL